MLPGVERGKVEGLYFVPIIYPIGVVVLAIVICSFMIWYTATYPYESNREQPAVKVVQAEG